MIYTSYFAKYKGNKGISIARWCSFFHGETCSDLMPTLSILKWWKSLKNPTKEDEEKYRVMYYEQVLNKLDVNEIAYKLNEHVLLCYEKSNDFCHRHIVAEWFNYHGYECKEI